MADKYPDFATLARNERAGVDFGILVRRARPAFAIVSPHGGGIEPGTSEIADGIAVLDFSYYAFEGLKSQGNSDLHITSTRFDEPMCPHWTRAVGDRPHHPWRAQRWTMARGVRRRPGRPRSAAAGPGVEIPGFVGAVTRIPVAGVSSPKPVQTEARLVRACSWSSLGGRGTMFGRCRARGGSTGRPGSARSRPRVRSGWLESGRAGSRAMRPALPAIGPRSECQSRTRSRRRQRPRGPTAHLSR